MKTTRNKLREEIRSILKEFLFTSLLPSGGDEDEEEYSIAKRIGGRHTARLDYSEADDLGLEEDEEEEGSE